MLRRLTVIVPALICWAIGAVLASSPVPARSVAPGPSSSASPPAIAVLSVDIWPEHDDPRLLVIYRGTLAAGVSFPQTLTFTIPQTGQVSAVAYRTDDGQLLSVQHQYRQEGDRLTVTFTIPARGFQFEYYVDAITGLPQRSFAVDLVFPLAVENLKVSVEQPVRSSAFTLTPPAGGTTAGAVGFTNHLYDVGRLPAGKVWQMRATYRKDDRNPSVARIVPTLASDAAAQPAAGTLPWRWRIGGAAALVLGGVAVLGYRRRWWMFEKPRAATARSRVRHRAKNSTTRGVKSQASSDRIHCTNCGARARPRDRFCSRCGQPLVQE